MVSFQRSDTAKVLSETEHEVDAKMAVLEQEKVTKPFKDYTSMRKNLQKKQKRSWKKKKAAEEAAERLEQVHAGKNAVRTPTKKVAPQKKSSEVSQASYKTDYARNATKKDATAERQPALG